MEERSKDDSLYAEYLKQHLGESLAWAVAEIVEIRPKDPIEYLAQWLYHSKGMNPQGASAFSRASSSTNSTNNRSVQSTPTSRMSHHINIKTSTGNEQTIEAKAAPRMIKTHISSTHIIKRTVDDDDDFIDEDITNISTHNSAMAHVHIDFNRIKEDLFDNDDIL